MDDSKGKLNEFGDIPNPFEHRIYLNKWQKLQLIVMSATVFPLRVIGLFIATFLLCLVCTLATFGLPLVPNGPLEGWRRKLKPVVRALLRFAFFCCGYHKICVKGRENLNPDHDPDIVVAAPHTTFFDPIAIFALNDLPTGVSRIENIQLPFLGYITKFFTPICVTRSDLNSRRETITQIRLRVLARMKYRNGVVRQKRDEGRGEGTVEEESSVAPLNWSPICLFPEGTTGNGKNLITFKIGAFIPGESVQPICVRHVNSMNTTSWTWVGDGVWKIMWMTMCQWSTTLVLTILPLYEPSEEERKDPNLYAKNVQSFMSRKIGIPCVDFSFFDGPLVVYLSKLHLQPVRPLVRLNRVTNALSKRSGTNLSELVERIAESELPCEEDALSLEQFSRVLDNHQTLREGLLEKVDSQELFEAVADAESRMVDVRKFIIWFCIACQPQRTWALVEIAFRVYTSVGKRGLMKSQLSEVLRMLFQCSEAELDITLDCITSHFTEPSSADLLTLAQKADDDDDGGGGDANPVTCQCLKMLWKFTLSKKDLLADKFDSGKRLRFDRPERLSGRKGRDGKDVAKLSNCCHGNRVADGSTKEE